MNQLPCPNCGLNPDPDEQGVKAWPCNYCPTVICQWCYHAHTGDKHPHAYSDKPTEGNEKKRKK